MEGGTRWTDSPEKRMMLLRYLVGAYMSAPELFCGEQCGSCTRTVREHSYTPGFKLRVEEVETSATCM
jgi:hypothetical protein